MKNINDKTKKRLIISGGLVISAVLIIMIGSKFNKEPIVDAVIPQQENEVSNAVADTPDKLEITEKEEEITVAPINIPEETQQDDGAVDTETDQKIQGDVPEKPTYTEEELTDPTQKPDGEKVEPPKEDEEEEPTPTPTPEPEPTKTETKTETEPKSSGGLPGFDSVPDGGENQVIEGEDMYENGNKIGDMN